MVIGRQGEGVGEFAATLESLVSVEDQDESAETGTGTGLRMTM
jgi:hypothetical protein